jgi:hypothetical protein
MGIILCVVMVIVLYFTILKKKMCSGDLVKCPSSDVSLCVNSGTPKDDWKGMCSKLVVGRTGGFGI